MNTVYKNFYRNFYLRTNGFIPAVPINQTIYPGDLFQLRQGELIILANIFKNGIIDPKNGKFDSGIKLNTASWSFGDGVTKPYSGRGTGIGPVDGEFEFSKQILAFEKNGSFLFKGNNPESVKITNWSDFQQDLLIKLTTTHYSFREVYVVTESATTSDWTLAIASAEKAELEIATDAENFGLTDIFGHSSAKTIQSKNIEFYNRVAKRTPAFFKAKKLEVQGESLENLINELNNQQSERAEWARDFYKYDFKGEPSTTYQAPNDAQNSILDMLKANELNPNTALRYFTWVDANLDDVEKLFLNYGE